MLRLRKRLLLGVAVLAVAGAAAAIAYAGIPGSDGVIHACYQKSNGGLRVIGADPVVGGGACSNAEQSLD